VTRPRIFAGNYRRTASDCESAIKLDPSIVKAYFRGAKAYYILEKYPEAKKLCRDGLGVDNKNATLLSLLQDIEAKEKEALDANRSEQERLRAKQKAEFQLRKALEVDESQNSSKRRPRLTPCLTQQLRGIKYDSIAELQSTPAPFSPVHVSPEGHLVWPVCFLYPEFKETDFIAEFDEMSSFVDHLSVMFEQPPPWSNDYVTSNLQVYAEVESFNGGKKLLQISKQDVLVAALTRSGYVVRNGVPSFIILNKNSPFADEFKAQYG
jgi:tetratricopeptide (TPR) repeat protein